MLAVFQLGLKFYDQTCMSFLRNYFLLVCLLETRIGPGLFLATIFDVQLCCCWKFYFFFSPVIFLPGIYFLQ